MPLNHAQLLNGLSASRLKTYRAPLGISNTTESVKPYFLLNDITQHFYVPIQAIELTLRNQTNQAIVNRLTNQLWYDSVPISQQSIDTVAEAKRLAKNEVRGRGVMPDDVVCRLTFGFWVYLFDAPYRDTSVPHRLLWTQHSIKGVFPNLPPGLGLKILFQRLKNINDLRNRLFHHEPIWKGSKVGSVDDAIKNLEQHYNDLIDVLSWMSPEQNALLKAWGFAGRLSVACDSKRFDRRLW